MQAMKKKELMQDPNFTARFAIILDGKLYKSLPQGKSRHLASFMNETLVPKITEDLVIQYFNSGAKKVPSKNFQFLVEIMADALRDTAELMVEGMSKDAISLKRQYDKAAQELKTVKQELALDIEARKVEEIA